MTAKTASGIKLGAIILGIAAFLSAFLIYGFQDGIKQNTKDNAEQFIKLENHEQRIKNAEGEDTAIKTQLLRMGTKMDENRDLLAKIMRESIAETREELREEIRTTNTLINAKK